MSKMNRANVSKMNQKILNVGLNLYN